VDGNTQWGSLNVHLTLEKHVGIIVVGIMLPIGIIIVGTMLPIGIGILEIGSSIELKTLVV
jgi:hypothetical protein